MSLNTDYANLMNQNALNYASGLLNSGNNTKIAGMDPNLIQQWSMLGPNSAAYRKLLEAQELGEIKKEPQYTDLMSDKFFNDYYDTKTGQLTKPTYTPDPATTATVDSKLSAGELLDQMRRLALAAINNPNSLNPTHYDLFEQMRQKIVNGLVTSGSGSEAPTVTVEEATPATLSKNVGDFHLLTDTQNFTVSGSKGEMNYQFNAGDSLQSIVSKINGDSETTGVTAELTKGDDGQYTLSLKSTDTGKDSSVKVYQNVGDLFSAAGESVSANGTDAVTEKGTVESTGDQTTAAVAVGVFTGKLFGDQAFTISGARGSKDYSFANGTDIADVVSAINGNADATGVMAEVIYNDAGEAEGIGLIADKAGTGQYVKIEQKTGDLFANAGGTVKVTGSGTTDTSGPAIASLSDLGKVMMGKETYSFADLGPGGSASMAKNPSAALAVIDQALKDIYEGRAQIKGFDPADEPLLNMSDTKPTTAGNTLEIGNFGSKAISRWISGYIKDSQSAGA